MLTPSLAQEIANKMMEVVPYNINIMDRNGVIIASGDESRIGFYHSAAHEAVKKSQTMEVAENYNRMFQGLNMPIIFDKNVIGIVGITGNPAEVRPFGEIVRVTAQLLVQQKYSMHQTAIKERLLETFLYEWLHEERYNNDFIQRGEKIGIDVRQSYVTCVIESSEEFRREQLEQLVFLQTNKNYFIQYSSQLVVIFIRATKTYMAIVDYLCDTFKQERIALGTPMETVQQSFHQAMQALRFGKELRPHETFHTYEKIWLIDEFCQFTSKSHVQAELELLIKAGRNTDLIDTLLIYMENNGDANKVSQKLHIHRNTLQYRIEKIEEVTGKNLNNLLDMFELYIIALAYKLQKDKN
ncbi:MAG: CdaR family transcriptional regulator [Culicoidibacterales bacterium]